MTSLVINQDAFRRIHIRVQLDFPALIPKVLCLVVQTNHYIRTKRPQHMPQSDKSTICGKIELESACNLFKKIVVSH